MASSSRSFRTIGSPPERPSCSTPSPRAWVKTRFQSSVASSPSARIISSGLEQYGQWSGQRWVSSASNVVGRSVVTDQLPLRQMRQILGDVGGDVGLIPLAEDPGDLPDGAPAIHQLEDRLAGV